MHPHPAAYRGMINVYSSTSNGLYIEIRWPHAEVGVKKEVIRDCRDPSPSQGGGFYTDIFLYAKCIDL